MTLVACGIVAVLAFSLGWIAACAMIAGKLHDWQNANEFLREEVERWRKEYENLKNDIIKHNR